MAKILTSENNVTYSEPYNITYSTAQGSCLGALLFILFCNAIKLLPLYGKLILFTDDTTLINHHRNFLRFSILHDLEILIDWFKANQLSLNFSKTVILNFWEKDEAPGITLDNRTIPVVKSTKFLGVHLDNEIPWQTHVDQLHKKLMTNKMLLSTNRNLLSTECLRSIYYAHVYSHLVHGLLVWGPLALQKAIKDLAQIQNACIRIICKKSKPTNVIQLYRELKMLRLPEMIILELAKYSHKIIHKQYQTTLHKLVESNGGKKTHCYPTCYKCTLNIQKHAIREFNQSHLCKGLSVFNCLP